MSNFKGVHLHIINQQKKTKMDINFYIKQTQAALINANYTKDELHYLFTDVSNRRTVTDGFENNTPIIDVIADLADTMDCIRSIRETGAC